MPKNPAVDDYIEKAQPFAKPILKRLRAAVHKACPECVEVMKWSFPNFDYKGPFCSMASFKAHAVFGFWKAALLEDANGILETNERTAMGHLGRITSLDELPDEKTLVALIRQAKELNDQGVKVARVTKKKPPLRVPKELSDRIAKNAAAHKTWDAFSPSHKREYVEWIGEAKTDATRERRIAQTLEQLADGKARNWKYEKKRIQD
ncbi:MAG: YdeI/OmpD-associated family protein [Phycisphaerae bacterium]|nr:YdeI/OmpD-associated family protein [Phycisphaerae bacterium]